MTSRPHDHATADQHQTLYATLGLPIETYEQFDDQRSQTIAPHLAEQPGGDPLVGLLFSPDARGQEEQGLRDLIRHLTSPDPRRVHLNGRGRQLCALFTDVNALALSVRPIDNEEPGWGEGIDRWDRARYAAFFDENLAWAQDARGERDLLRENVAQLRDRARALGVTPLPRRRPDLVAAICATNYGAPRSGWRWPAWFADGEILVLRADDGVTAQIVERLRDAVAAQTLALGEASGPFSHGLFLYDERDESQELKTKRTADLDWHEARMAEAAEVKAELRAQGVQVWHLGGPTERNGAVEFFINASVPTRREGLSGWFTLDDLRAGKLLKSAER